VTLLNLVALKTRKKKKGKKDLERRKGGERKGGKILYFLPTGLLEGDGEKKREKRGKRRGGGSRGIVYEGSPFARIRLEGEEKKEKNSKREKKGRKEEETQGAITIHCSI